MDRNLILGLLGVCLVVSLFWWFLGRGERLRWFVYYGPGLTPADFQNIDIAILEPEHMEVSNLKNGRTRFFGYVSVGEVNDSRDYWQSLQGKNVVVEKNANWPGAWRVDIRSKVWQDILLNQVIPSVIAKGYDGVFLDTVDTPLELETREPERFAGSKSATISFVRTLKQKFPDLLILTNNAFEILEDYGDIIYGEVTEDVDTLYKEACLDRFKNKFHKPVLNILYGNAIDDPVSLYAIRRSRQKGYNWYLTTRDLQKIGTIQK
ncbi:MAG: endo alpha-1,4 polygalactosaminidase [Deltaproteobacteria bacterium]|nr:endo alpha-1,4 polygalactosaminidase [Deltaproteobacteria bacterium]